MLGGLAHVTILVPPGKLGIATEFYCETIGLTSRPVPQLQKHELAWFDIGASGQQVHVALGENENLQSIRHPCFKVDSPEALLELQKKLWDHQKRGGEAAPLQVDEPGVINADAQGVEYPERFFARDFAGNRLEFSL